MKTSPAKKKITHQSPVCYNKEWIHSIVKGIGRITLSILFGHFTNELASPKVLISNQPHQQFLILHMHFAAAAIPQRLFHPIKCCTVLLFGVASDSRQVSSPLKSCSYYKSYMKMNCCNSMLNILKLLMDNSTPKWWTRLTQSIVMASFYNYQEKIFTSTLHGL